MKKDWNFMDGLGLFLGQEKEVFTGCLVTAL